MTQTLLSRLETLKPTQFKSSEKSPAERVYRHKFSIPALRVRPRHAGAFGINAEVARADARQ